MKNLRIKIGLGSVQFGLRYGIKNVGGKVGPGEVSRIISRARSGGIELLDTASGYGDSERTLGDCDVRGFDIVTKINPKAYTPDMVERSVRTSLLDLRVPRFYGVLVHDVSKFFGNPANWERLRCLRDDGVILKTGVSVYRPAELEQLLDSGFAIDIVQLPYNVLDTRFKGLLPRLKEARIEVHARSLFLQGLFFMDPLSLPAHFTSIATRIEHLGEISRQLRVSLSTVLLAFGALEPSIDRLIIGVDSEANLQENLDAVDLCSVCTPILDELHMLSVQDESIILPINWPETVA
jgi:aryl-alcohol dehydrogenase-like predicted oxidoreductase